MVQDPSAISVETHPLVQVYFDVGSYLRGHSIIRVLCYKFVERRYLRSEDHTSSIKML